MRGQIYFRDQGRTGDGAAVVAGVGIIEVPQGWFTENVVRGAILTAAEDGFALTLTSYVSDLTDDDHASHVLGSEIDAAATLKVWPLPSPLAGDVCGGGIMARRTRMPADPGREIMTCLVVLKAADGRPERDVMYEIEGEIDTPEDVSDPRHMPFSGRLACVRPRPVPDLVARGNHLNQLLKQPVWGFGAEGMAFTSTMSLADIDLCDEGMDLALRDDLNDEQRARLETLRRSHVGYVISTGDRDPDYQMFRKAMVAECGRLSFDGVLTASEVEARSEAARRLVGELLAERDAAPRP